MKKILILSEGNSVRSQMAEGWMRYYAGEHAEIFSAGTKENRGLNKLAHHLMMDSVIDIGNQSSDNVQKYKGQTFDHVIVLDQQAAEALPELTFANKHDFFLENPLDFKEDKTKMVQKFIDIRNKLDDYSFNFINQHIRSLIPPL